MVDSEVITRELPCCGADHVLRELEKIARQGRAAALQRLSAMSNPYLLGGNEDRFNAWMEGYRGPHHGPICETWKPANGGSGDLQQGDLRQ